MEAKKEVGTAVMRAGAWQVRTGIAYAGRGARTGCRSFPGAACVEPKGRPCAPPLPAADDAAARPQVPMLVFASFIAFNALSWFSLKIVNKNKRIRAPSNLVLLKAA